MTASLSLPPPKSWQPWFGEALCYSSDQGSTHCSMARPHHMKSWGPFCWGKSPAASAAQALLNQFLFCTCFVESSGSHVWLKVSGTGLCKWGAHATACVSVCIGTIGCFNRTGYLLVASHLYFPSTVPLRLWCFYCGVFSCCGSVLCSLRRGIGYAYTVHFWEHWIRYWNICNDTWVLTFF